ncbi:thioredoxin family protein [Chitinophaga nivalis]|uniref:Thioredoxin family protein n=1 Tax=Chitinophaga nivalis TaxID=2991709 RepID=A0ABT3IPX0_9BACT|nr:thioredoxin family protein [Chitinophaga nivalis]MCW3464363.1 thioredoxin family protein [Chitinophaga nivalis]MCW3485946.1 thioredoxin family protein [Chitinophaga nivalis]
MTNEKNTAQGTESLTLLQFYADWCQPCRMMMPIVESIRQKQYQWLDIQQIDIDREEDMADKYHVRSIPTFVALKNNQEVWRKSALLSEQALVTALSTLR